ncbi:MAG: EamA family transporter [Luteimonas sp.]
MDKWVAYAVISMIFAGFTSVIAKLGLSGISGELGLAIRTLFVSAFVLGFAAVFVKTGEIQFLSAKNYIWLGISGLTTAMSWIFYYKALKDGEVSTVALIDKASFIVAVLLAWLVLKEQITPRVLIGCLLVGSGLLVVAYRPAS